MTSKPSPKTIPISRSQTHDQSNSTPRSSLPRSYGTSLRRETSFGKQSPARSSPNAGVEFLKEHIVTRGAQSSSLSSFTGVHSLMGGETTRSIYAIQEKQDAPRRRNSAPSIHSIESETASQLLVPGAFRRHFMEAQAARAGQEPPDFLAKNFIDFLQLYGTYGGEFELEDESDIEELDVVDSEQQPLISRNTTPVSVTG